MDQLFIKLPRDLQWEILETFVGTHVVRNGKLMRKMSNNVKEILALKMTSGIWKKHTPKYLPIGTWVAYEGVCFNTNVILKKSHMMDIYLWENLFTRDITYCYYMYTYTGPTYKYELENIPSQTAYKKNEYPSYPFTDKKKALTSKNRISI
jgi:hypothetical protein